MHTFDENHAGSVEHAALADRIVQSVTVCVTLASPPKGALIVNGSHMVSESCVFEQLVLLVHFDALLRILLAEWLPVYTHVRPMRLPRLLSVACATRFGFGLRVCRKCVCARVFCTSELVLLSLFAPWRFKARRYGPFWSFCVDYVIPTHNPGRKVSQAVFAHEVMLHTVLQHTTLDLGPPGPPPKTIILKKHQKMGSRGGHSCASASRFSLSHAAPERNLIRSSRAQARSSSEGGESGSSSLVAHSDEYSRSAEVSEVGVTPPSDENPVSPSQEDCEQVEPFSGSEARGRGLLVRAEENLPAGGAKTEENQGIIKTGRGPKGSEGRKANVQASII
eukprot:6460611-Amphidinium_carterae.2